MPGSVTNFLNNCIYNWRGRGIKEICKQATCKFLQLQIYAVTYYWIVLPFMFYVMIINTILYASQKQIKPTYLFTTYLHTLSLIITDIYGNSNIQQNQLSPMCNRQGWESVCCNHACASNTEALQTTAHNSEKSSTLNKWHKRAQLTLGFGLNSLLTSANQVGRMSCRPTWTVDPGRWGQRCDAAHTPPVGWTVSGGHQFALQQGHNKSSWGSAEQNY